MPESTSLISLSDLRPKFGVRSISASVFLNQIANVDDVVVLEAVCRPHRKLQLVHFLQQKRVEFETIVFVLTTSRFGLVEVHKDRQLVLKDARGEGQLHHPA